MQTSDTPTARLRGVSLVNSLTTSLEVMPMKQIIFYRLAPKPPKVGWDYHTTVAMLKGKASRGRKWYRLEATSQDLYLFPSKTKYFDIWRWIDSHPDELMDRVVFLCDGELHKLANAKALDAIPGGVKAREMAMKMYEEGVPGWVVFTPDSMS